MQSQGSLGLATVLLTLSCISTVEARCVEDAFGNINCSPVIRPGVAFGISIAIFIVLLVVFGMLARQRRNRIRAANMSYIQQNNQPPTQQGYPQQGFPPSPYAPPYVPPYPSYQPPHGPPPTNEYNPENVQAYPSYQPPYGPPPTNEYNPENNKDGAPYVPPPAPQYPPPSYVVA